MSLFLRNFQKTQCIPEWQSGDPLKSCRIPIKISRSRFPCDFFSRGHSKELNVRLGGQTEANTIEHQVTPKFSSMKQVENHQDKFSQFLSKKGFHSYASSIQSGNINKQREYATRAQPVRAIKQDRTLTARPKLIKQADQKMVSCLNDIIDMTKSIKKVYRKHSLELKREKIDQINILPPLFSKRLKER